MLSRIRLSAVRSFLASTKCVYSIPLTDFRLIVLGFTAVWDSISVYIWPSPREREKEKRNDRRE